MNFLKKLGIVFLIAGTVFFAACNPNSGDGGGEQTGGQTGGQTGTGQVTVPEKYKDPVTGKTAAEIIKMMGAGWNLGNTLDAAEAGDSGDSSKPGSGTLKGIETETSWSMPKTTKTMIDVVAAAGFSHIRVPVSWHNHIQNDGTIDPKWLARVKEIVDWVIEDGMFCVINIHHDTWSGAGTFWGYCVDGTHTTESEKFVEDVWQQVATYFKEYDQRLVFETLNEPRLRANGVELEWTYNSSNAKCKTAATTINTLNKKALVKIRAAGSKNSERLVIVPPYVASPWAAFNSDFSMPTDTVSNLLALSVHAYSPYSFAMQSPGETTFTSAHKSDLDNLFNQLKSNFIDNDIPVFIGEYGATNKNNSAERVNWAKYYVNGASEKKMAYCLWDNNKYTVTGTDDKRFDEHFGYFDRDNLTWYDEDFVKAITGCSDLSGGSSDDSTGDNTDPTPGEKTVIDLTVGTTYNDDSVPNKYTATTSGTSVILSHSGNITPEKQNWNINPSFGDNSKVEIKITNTGSGKAFVKVSIQNSSYANVITEATVNGTAIDAQYGALAEIEAEKDAVFVLTIGSGASQLAITLNGEGNYGSSGLEGLRSDMPTSGSITISEAYMY